MAMIWTKRVGSALSRGAVRVGFLAVLGLSTTGCGALGALTNPKAAWALDEPAPMSVVVRRAEVASMTSEQVDRLLGGTALDSESKWVPDTALSKDEAKALLESIGANDTYAAAGKKGKLRVAPAEAWYAHFSGICSSEEEHENLLAATSGTLADEYKAVAKLQDELSALKLSLADTKLALEAKDVSADKKAELEKKVEEIEAKIDKTEDEVDPKKDAFIAKVREEAGKADDATKKRVGVALLNLKRAVEDAKTMNSVALLRYPMAVTTLHEDVQSSAKRVVADVIEEQVGKRPDLGALKPEVKIDGGDVKLTLAGLSPSELLSLKPDEVIEETTLRLTNYVGRVLTLIAFVDESQTRLTFQGKVLDAWIEGMKLTPASVSGAGDELDLVVDTTGAKKGKAEEASGQKRYHTPGGLRTVRCDAKAAAAPVVAEVKEPAPKQKVATGKKGGAPAAKQPPSEPTGGVSAATMVGGAGTVPASLPGGSSKAKSSGDKPCDVVVENAEGTFCL